ncbi:MAG: Ig-like domain-containing domain [Bacteroidales bacterium]|nr:Ig-like domain-containing domain [Bacteroidales bacterium]
MNFATRLVLSTLILAIVTSCANIGRPNGGPIDTTPPRLVKSIPMQGQINFNKKKIELEFDEIVLVENASDKVNVSPPQSIPPEISTNGRKIIVELQDSLKKNSTYTIDFSDAIVDNNEKNPFNNFALSFSTGSAVDSLEISGTLLNACDLEPVTGMYVGIHKLLDDSAFVKTPFDRITRSDALGKFNIKNVAAGRYRIYALKDANRDYKFDQSGEDIAYSDSIIVPSFEYFEATDTLKTKVGKVIKDSLIQVRRKRFTPDNLVLMAFNENFKSQYLDKTERKQRNKLTITFAAPANALPKLKPLNFSKKDWAILEQSATNDTLNYWIKDSTIYKQDTLLIEATYLKTDSLKNLSPQTDTLKFIFNDLKIAAKKKKKKDEVEKIEIPSLNVEPKFSSTLEIYDDLVFTTPVPLDSLIQRNILLEEKKDTAWKVVKTALMVYDSLHIREYRLNHKWTPDGEYRLTIDSATFYGFNGLCNKAIKKTFKVKSLELYSSLFLKVTGFTGNAFVELLNESDKSVRKEPVINGTAEFYYVNPGNYYARLVEDRNSNFVWDTGTFAKKIAPESVYYYNTFFELRPNWDVEQEWNIQSTPTTQQKPMKLVKNKPKEKKPKIDELSDSRSQN